MKKIHNQRKWKRIAVLVWIGLLLSTAPVLAADYSEEYRSYDGSDHRDSSSKQNTVLFIIIVLPIAGGMFIYFSIHHDEEPDAVLILNVMKTDDAGIVSEIQKADPQFSETAFKQFAAKRILLLQKALSEKDFCALKYMDTELLYLHHKELIENMHERTSYMEFQKIKGLSIEGFHRSLDYDTLTLICFMSLVEFVKNADGVIISGSDSMEVERTYAVEFLRPLVKSSAGLENCPNCGAPLEIVESGKCAYCHTVIVNKNIDWMINRYDIR